MPDIGVPELLIIAVIVVLLFGPGKASDLGGALGKSIREFRRASNEDEAPKDQTTARATLDTPTAEIAAPAADTRNGAVTAGSGAGRFCTECGTAISDSQKFCTSCGTPTAVAT